MPIVPTDSPPREPDPWYRDRWPWLLIAGPATVVIAGFATLWIALATDDPVVTADYYARGVAINRELEGIRRAETLRAGATLRVEADGRIALRLRGAFGGAPPPAIVRLRIVHPTRGGRDSAPVLRRTGGLDYESRIDALASGLWRIEIEADDWRLPHVEATLPGEVLLGSARDAS